MMENKRLASIDILRAVTMLLMIWVNDFWSLTGVPKWLKHAQWGEDYLGFSDIIFPLFLFIVGLSIPLSIEQRQSKGQSALLIAKHTIIRSASLLLIGFYMVNYESMHNESLIIHRLWYCTIMTIAVGLIWMNWKRSPVAPKWHIPLQLLGLALLVFLAVIYKGGEDGTTWMTPQWWGILGLIGWAYLANALLYLVFKGNLTLMSVLFLVFIMLAVLNFRVGLPQLPEALFFFNPIYKGTLPAFTTGGIVATLLVKKLSINRSKWISPTLIVLGIATITFGISTRPIWGISKLAGSPSWLGICVGIGFILFAVFYVIADVAKKTSWARIIKSAGTATLTCYMLPYIIEPLRHLIVVELMQNSMNMQLPEFLYIGITGLIYAFVYALFIVLFTGWIEKKGFKLKL